MSESEQHSLQPVQAEIDDYIQQFKTGYSSSLGQIAHLAEEVGELAREVNRYYDEKQEKADEKPKTVSEGLGDVFFVLVSMANSLRTNLTEVFEENMAKFNRRDRHRFEREDGKAHD